MIALRNPMVQVNESEVELSREEILALIDEGARHRLGISGEKLLELYRRGQLRDLGEVADLLVLATLLEDQAAA
jgi:hypothetical protein